MQAALWRSAEKIALPNVAERRQVHLINPRACAGKYAETAKRLATETGSEVVFTERAGFAEDYAAELFTRDPFAHLVVYGGDGTTCEAVNGIMRSGRSLTASFSVIPFGSGNDFSAYANAAAGFAKAELVRLDLCRVGERYFINMLNIGFDCNVVYRATATRSARRIKKLFGGKAAYLAGVARELAAKKAVSAEITLDGGEKRTLPILLTACANGRYCGGGFCAAPLADMTDGLMDVLVVNDVTRRKFLALVEDYRTGAYIDADGILQERFEDALMYRRCVEYRVAGIERYCIDGEIVEAEDGEVTVRCEKGAIWFAAL